MTSAPTSMFTQPGFARFFAAQCVSLVGSWTQIVTVLYLLYRQTGAATTVAFATGAQAASMLTTALLVGSIIDRWAAPRVIAAAQVASIIVSGYFWLSERTADGPALVICGLLVLGAFSAAEAPSRQAVAFDLLGPERITGAGGLFGLAQSASRVAGAGISAVLIAITGAGFCFAVNAASSMVLLWVVLRLPCSTRDVTTRPRSGLEQILRTEAVRVPFVVLTITGVVGMNYQVLLPVMSGRGATSGVLHAALTAALGAGALAGSAWAARRRSVHRAQLSRCASGLALSNAALMAAGASWSSAPALAGAGACVSVLFATTSAQLQLSADPTRRVQTMSLVAISVSAATAIGDPIVGALVRYGGLRSALAASCITAFVAAVYALRHPFHTAAVPRTRDVGLDGGVVR